MTHGERRTLLTEVEERGGPKYPLVLAEAGVADLIFIGYLKRDLVERGFEPTVSVGKRSALVSLFREGDNEKPEHNTMAPTELEALLEVWLVAADTEGWTYV